MGYYINNNSKGEPMAASFESKCRSIIADGGVECDSTFKENLVCVVNNGMFAAAAFAYDEQERDEFAAHDGREKRWFTYEHAKRLSGFKG